ncbi:hypothetical protein [Desulfobacterium sp. N47]|uniref:SH3 domain protein n=1 Tax=uncultured Desulfobacterium sp. TaxID=201089 RepID=E1YJ76_9BACT|nr:hypothetical protein N47_E48420 [uncultured Desulfobacterium sp.]
MDFIVKCCIIIGSLLAFYTLPVQAETTFYRHKPEQIIYNGKSANSDLKDDNEFLKQRIYIASNETGNMPKSQINVLRAENAELNTEINQLNRELADSKYLLAISNKSLDKLKDTSDEYTELKTKHDETVLMLSNQNEKVDKLEDEITKLLRQQNIRWFFSGAAVFLLGFIIGYSARREKRRSLL